MFVLSRGNAFEGLTLVGPFDNGEAAAEYAEENESDDDWSVVSLETPIITTMPNWQETLDKFDPFKVIDELNDVSTTLTQFVLDLNNGDEGAHAFLREIASNLENEEDGDG